MSGNSTVARKNIELAEQINAEAKRDSNSPYAGKFVGIANGEVIVVADDWNEVRRRLKESERDPSKCCAIEASADYDRVHEIWSLD